MIDDKEKARQIAAHHAMKNATYACMAKEKVDNWQTRHGPYGRPLRGKEENVDKGER